jgi:hypothetical protein
MTPLGVFVEVLARVGAGGEVFITEHELTQWPASAVSAMKAQKLIGKAPPATSVICPGCERNCAMPVETIPARSGASAQFVVCDKLNDINRVAISAGQLIQWQANTATVAKFIAKSLSVRWRGTTIHGNELEIGIVKATRKSQMLCLRSGREMMLLAGTSKLPLVEVITFAEGRFELDGDIVEQLVNNSTTSDERYTSSNAKREAGKLVTQARRESWKKEYRRLKKLRPDMSDAWIAIQISKMDIAEGRSSETIRKNMK